MFYQKDIQTVLKECQTSQYGLTSKTALQHQKDYGYNQLDAKKEESLFIVFFKQFQDLLVIILMIAAIVSGISGQWESTLVIVFVIIMNALLGTIQTLKARKSLESLKNLSQPHVKVLRDHHLQEIEASLLTIGDIVHIEAGDMISGDGRLIECSSLKVNESALTGEVESIEKDIQTIHETKIINDQTNMVFSGSLVTQGVGTYVVTEIGMKTEIGKIATLLNQTSERKTPLQKNLDDFSQTLSIVIMIISFLVFLMNIFLSKLSFLDSLMIAVALAVAAIPEALGSIVTIVLSMSTQKMVKENAILKNLNAIESLGCVSIICSDKTGTLTQNKMTPHHIYFYNNTLSTTQLDILEHDHYTLLKACSFCNNASIYLEQRIGDPTELALIDFVSLYPQFTYDTTRINELPFDSQRKMMSVSSSSHLYSKGAVDVLLKKCDFILIHGRKEKLSTRHIHTILNENQRCASEGLRVLGFAYKDFHKNTLSLQDENHLTFIGLVSIIDPPRAETKEAVSKCIQAGIKPIMITGDHVITAKSIAKQIGIFQEGDKAIDGETLHQMSDKELLTNLHKISVYARVAPAHKIRIVKAWQKQGHVVAMTGDGVNDAPALKQSDIGIAMGITGSEVAKDAASMVLTDDNFATIVDAIMTGRHIYQNIRNAILYLLSGNFAGILCVLITSLLVLPTPFFPVHLLFMNLITDSLPAIAIGMEKSQNQVLHEKPRDPHVAILNKKAFLQISYEGIVIAICTICSYMTGLKGDPLVASTMAFSTICLARLLHGFNSRSHMPLLQLGIFSNKPSLYAFLFGFILLHLILFIPVLQKLFSVHPISLIQLLCIYAFALIPTLIIQTQKQLRP